MATRRLRVLAVTPTPLRHAPGVALAALGSLAFGAVLGPEAPIIALDAVVGAAVAPLARLGARDATVLAMAGAFSAIAAIFGGPLVASFMLIEASLFLGAALVPTLLPGLVAAAVGYGGELGLLFSPVLFAALLVGSAGQDAVPAAVLASVAASLTVTALERRQRASSAATSTPGARRSGRPGSRAGAARRQSSTT